MNFAYDPAEFDTAKLLAFMREYLGKVEKAQLEAREYTAEMVRIADELNSRASKRAKEL